MDYWFLDNLDKLVPIIIAVLYFIGASRAKGKRDEPEGPSPDASERARKIQEEIRRKIIERQGEGRAPAPPPEPEPVFEPAFEPDPSPLPPRPFQEPVFERKAESFPEPEPFIFDAPDPYEEERRKIEDKLKQARELAKKAEIAGKKASMKNRSKDLEWRFASSSKNSILDGLDDTTSIRRAIVLKEVLDTPVGLR